jgi:hypothetical protein
MVDVTTNTTPRTILLKGRNVHTERVAGGTVRPGSFTVLASGNTVTENATAKSKIPLAIAVENELEGLGIDDSYLVNDLVQMERLHAGMEVLAFVAASAAALVIGDLVELDGAGGVRKMSAAIPLTDAVGTPIGTGIMLDVTATPTQTLVNNNFATVAAQFTALTQSTAIGQVLAAVDNSGNSGSIARVPIVIL